MLINYELLRTLLEAGLAPTFAEAAKRRRVTPSAVSHQISALEAQIGAPLFERVGRSMRLTPAGEDLVRTLREAFTKIDDALSSASADHSRVAGTVRIGGPGPFSRFWLRPRLVQLLAEYPELLVEVHFDVWSVLARRLLKGDDDVSILSNPPDSPLLASKPIFVEEFVAVASPSYLKRHKRLETASDFAEHRFVVFDADLAMHAAWWRASFGKEEPLPPRIACRIASLDGMLALAIDQIGIAVLPSYFVDSAVKSGQVVIVGPSARKGGRAARNTLYLAWRKATVESARLRVVRETLLAEMV